MAAHTVYIPYMSFDGEPEGTIAVCVSIECPFVICKLPFEMDEDAFVKKLCDSQKTLYF